MRRGRILENVKRIRRLDDSNMYELLVAFPKMMEDASDIGSRFSLPTGYKKRYSSIVFSGVGGSAIGADFVRSYLEEEVKIPIIVNRDYTSACK